MLIAKIGLSLLCGFGEDDKMLLVHDNGTNNDNDDDDDGQHTKFYQKRRSNC